MLLLLICRFKFDKYFQFRIRLLKINTVRLFCSYGKK